MFPLAARSWQRWTAIRQEQGARNAWRWLAYRFGARTIKLSIAEVVWLSLPDIKMNGTPPAGFRFAFLTPEEIAGYLSPEYELSQVHVERAAAGHDLCFAALQDDRLAAYGWYARGSIEAMHSDYVAMSFPEDVAYMYKGFTHPDFRGQRLHGFAMRLALETLAADYRISHLLSTVDLVNEASLKSCDRLGYQRLGRIVKIAPKLLGWNFYPAQALARGVNFGRQADLSAREHAFATGPVLQSAI